MTDMTPLDAVAVVLGREHAEALGASQGIERAVEVALEEAEARPPCNRTAVETLRWFRVGRPQRA